MMPLNHQFGKLFFLFTFILFFCACVANGQQIRDPVYAGRFYPSDPQELKALLERYATLAEKNPVSLPKGAVLKALILPHAGYIYSGLTAAHASIVLKDQKFNKVIIMGPDHRAGFQNCAISDVTAYATPFGKVLLDPAGISLCQKYKKLFRPVRKSDELEHSIEVQIPFLQHYLCDFQIVPIVTGSGDINEYADAIDTILDPQTLIVISSDLSHYLPYDQAVKKDHETIAEILTLNLKQLSLKNSIACGIIPIQVLTRLALRHEWKPILLHYSNSGDTAGPKDRVVGYAAIAYYETSVVNQQKGFNRMDKKKGDILLNVARKSIEKKLNVHAPEADDLDKDLSDKIYNARRGTFVTLKKNGQLRGCIGNLMADKSVLEGVQDNAINAAFHDPRFPPLSKNELEQVDIEISLLTEPQILEYKDKDDLLEKLRPNVDGVIIRKGPYSATFLPQVWEQLPDKKSFLGHLCSKAGLPPDEWQRGALEVMTYQVQYFEEDH